MSSAKLENPFGHEGVRLPQGRETNSAAREGSIARGLTDVDTERPCKLVPTAR